MLTQEQINQDWTVRSDNYNRYVEEEFATERPAKWLERMRKMRLLVVRSKFWTPGADLDFFLCFCPGQDIR